HSIMNAKKLLLSCSPSPIGSSHSQKSERLFLNVGDYATFFAHVALTTYVKHVTTRCPMYNSQLVASRANLASSYTHRPQRYLNFLYSWYLASTTCLLRDAMPRRQVHLPPFRNIASSGDLFYSFEDFRSPLI